MTRFARAKGSKSSNQRLPDEATPWDEMKQVKTDNNDNSENFTKEETNWKVVIDTEKRVEENLNSVWCDFGESEEVKSSKKDNKRKRSQTSNEESHSYENLSRDHEDDALHSKTKRKFKRSKSQTNESSNLNSGPSALDSNPSEWSNNFEWQKDIDKQEHPQGQTDTQKSKFEETRRYKGSKNWSVTGKEQKRFSFQSQPHMRRKCDDGDVTLNINGQEITVTRLDGFYIRKEDAERIRDLEKDLLKRGVSKEEIRAVVKKERRNAEKSLARQKKKVCFHCRQGGHNLSSCPKLNEGGTQVIGSGICYKCGSTEHSHLQCRVTSGQSFKFATCFICKEEGHIAKQCPDNPRGLYPDGGACKLCGDVTHFKKDCPNLPTKSKVTVGTIDGDIETLGDADAASPPKPTNTKKNKVIKFK